MQKITKKITFLFGIPLLILMGCGPEFSSSTYDAETAAQAAQTFQGVIVSSRVITIANERFTGSGVGLATGALAGGAVGMQFGEGRTSALGGVGGALAGGLAGAAIESQLAKKKKREYVIRLLNGQLVTVVQELEPQLVIGQPVLVMIPLQGGRARVVPDSGAAPAPVGPHFSAPAQHVHVDYYQSAYPAPNVASVPPQYAPPAGSTVSVRRDVRHHYHYYPPR